MDFVVQLPKTKRGFDAILVVVDRLTKRLHLIPTFTTATAPDTAKTFMDQIFRLHGLPKTIVSDRDPKFVSKFWKTLFKQLGVQLAFSTAYHPQTDGQTERANRTIEDMLRTFVNYKQDNWDDCLPAVEFAYNNSLQASTGYTPFYLDCGQHPITPGELLGQDNTPSNVAATEDFLQHLKTIVAMAKEAILAAQERQAQYANQHRRNEQFKIGDQVLLSTAHLTAQADVQRPLKKFRPKFIGPYPISAVISSTAYRLTLPHTLKIHPVFHISLLKRHNPNSFPNRQQDPPPPVVIDSPEVEFEVEAILDKRILYGKTQYLVLWKGYPRHDATWEPKRNVAHAQELVQDFEAGLRD